MSELTGTTKINYSWRELKQLEVKYFTIYSSLFINGFSFPFLFVCAWNLTLLHICILLFSYFLWQAAKWNEMTIIPFEMANGPHHNANVMNARHKCKFHKDINAIRILYVGQLFRKRKIIYIRQRAPCMRLFSLNKREQLISASRNENENEKKDVKRKFGAQENEWKWDDSIKNEAKRHTHRAKECVQRWCVISKRKVKKKSTTMSSEWVSVRACTKEVTYFYNEVLFKPNNERLQ